MKASLVGSACIVTKEEVDTLKKVGGYSRFLSKVQAALKQQGELFIKVPRDVFADDKDVLVLAGRGKNRVRFIWNGNDNKELMQRWNALEVGGIVTLAIVYRTEFSPFQD